MRLPLVLSLGLAFGLAACAPQKSHQRSGKSQTPSAAEQKVMQAAPKRLVARIKVSDLKSNDMSKVEFVPVTDSSADAKKSAENFGLVETTKTAGQFMLVENGKKPDAQGLGLCGGGGCGGGGCAQPACGNGCGGCGGGGYVLGWIGNLIRGAGQVIGSIFHGIGNIFTSYTPWFAYGGGFCAYNQTNQWQQGGYQYYQFDQGNFWGPGQQNPNQPIPNQPIPNYEPGPNAGVPVQPSQPIVPGQPVVNPSQPINQQVPFTYPNQTQNNGAPVNSQPIQPNPNYPAPDYPNGGQNFPNNGQNNGQFQNGYNGQFPNAGGIPQNR